ncbi:MAG: beta-carotene 15,15'-monooxygenase [Peptoniphilus sp.]|uniref:beta-carotene 15,15'-monooxygenase n=1 Tax=Peptoniphilus sp. TaxID=1971214 RepID=UPI0025ED4698|nr:beta-carotene 15,15'-monooxygenase [Peptoniphilus sp.]MCI5643339.1 beta-carotene 15,15'-monooxygenase [Peptoniphilus sp.]MDD7351867.1 beta-carotene 15,15'-monooxygenase [Peptoniphilaceae bacterium]
MRNNMNINKACRYYLFRDKDIILNIIVCMIIVLGFSFLLYKNVFESKSTSYVLLMLYVLIVGLTQITANSMIINLTVKDKLNKRIEFIIASGINIKNIIRAYTIEMWRISSILPFFLFFFTYYLYDFKKDFKWIVGIYISTVIMLYFEILFLNIFSLSRKNFKFFKNLVFFGTTLFIYIVGSFSNKILNLLDKYDVNLIYLIVGINIILLLTFGIFSIINLARINNESIINKEGTWS